MYGWKRILGLVLLTLPLAACGGGGGQEHVAATPPPPSPRPFVVGQALAPTPALISGTYDAIGVSQTSDANHSQTSAGRIPAGALRISVDAAAARYTLTFDTAVFQGLTPAGVLSYTITDPRYGHAYTQQTTTDGRPSGTYEGEGRGGSVVRHSTETGDPKSTQFVTLVGQRHVSLGQWDWWTSPDGKDRGSVMFAYGDRTPLAGIPASGTATYKMTEFIGLGYDESNAFDVTLNADFGARTIGADVDYNSIRPEDVGYRTELSGSAPVSSSGDFSIALNGTRQTGKLDQAGVFTPGTNPSLTPVTGSLAGAFFGPDASEIGGTMLLPDPTGAIFTLAFAAEKK